jgi:hypothetical protein
MATATPAAPSTPAPAASPATTDARPALTIRPIPSTSGKPTQKGLGFKVGSPPALPGVMDEPEDVPADDSGVAPDGAPAEALADAPTEPAPVEEPPAEPEPGVWLNLDLGDGQVAKFRDEEHLKQNLRTIRGQFRSMQQNEVSANEKAYGWHQQATRYEGMLRALGIDPETGAISSPVAGATPGAAPGSTTPAEQPLTVADVERELTEAVDWNIARQLLQRNPMEALAYVQMESAKATSKFIAEKLPSLVDARIAPLQEQAERAQGITTVSQFWSQARAAKDQNGNPVFPEIQTDQGLNELGRVWVALRSEHNLPLEFLMTPQGLQTAVLWYRAYQAGQGAAAAPVAPPNPAQQVAAQVRAAVDTRANAGSVVPGGAKPSAPSPTARPADPRKAVAAAIMAAGPSKDWGVSYDD